MGLLEGAQKEVILTTRDFCAVSWAKDGTDFHVELRAPRSGGVSARVRDWFDVHRFDHYRIAFQPDEEDPLSAYLQCHDETEALSLVLSLQRELDEALT